MIWRPRTKAALAASLLVVTGVLSMPHVVSAQPTLSTSASIVVLPKIISDVSRDTLVEIANTSNSQVSAFCLYLDGDSGLQVNFDIGLARQNPLRWNASTGLPCPDGGLECTFAGGLIPPVPLGFRGALACVEVDASGSALSGNHLAAGATVLDLTSGDASAYEPIGVIGTELNDGDDVLCLGPEAFTANCPFGPEYQGCPDQWILNHVAEGAEDPVAGQGSSVSTELTLINCGADFFSATATPTDLQIVVTNELEQRFSAQIAFAEAWRATTLADLSTIFDFNALGTTYAYTTITSEGGSVAIVAREVRQTAGPTPATASAGFSLSHTGVSTNDHAIVLPPRQ